MSECHPIGRRLRSRTFESGDPTGRVLSVTDERQKREKRPWIVWIAGLGGCVGGSVLTSDVTPLAGAIMIAGFVFAVLVVLIVISIRRLRAARQVGSGGKAQ